MTPKQVENARRPGKTAYETERRSKVKALWAAADAAAPKPGRVSDPGPLANPSDIFVVPPSANVAAARIRPGPRRGGGPPYARAEGAGFSPVRPCPARAASAARAGART